MHCSQLTNLRVAKVWASKHNIIQNGTCTPLKALERAGSRNPRCKIIIIINNGGLRRRQLLKVHQLFYLTVQPPATLSGNVSNLLISETHW